MKNVRIVSDGTPYGTKVFDADGKAIEGLITRIEWSISAGTNEVAEAKITFGFPEVELQGEIQDG